jgi:peptidoglycan/LPS O-acetylase OafA/YrhL/lysophospholipase L1-like esterase
MSPEPVAPSITRARIDGLDGLRALAVVGVLLYHADVRWARGGFVGVDVFFVLSGYLVTSIVLGSLAKRGHLGFRRFWAARFRRLLPAQVTLFAAVTLAVAIGWSNELATLRSQVLAALTGTTNWYLIATQASYFDQLGRPPLFRHLWSLAIELQFYLVFPLVLIVVLRRWGDRLERVVAGLAVAILASTVWMAILYHPNTDPTRAYFDTFARLAAPLTGAVLALVWRPEALRRAPIARRPGPSTAAGVAALVVLLWIMHTAGDRSASMYRGGFLLTAIASAVVVAAITHPATLLGGRRAFGHPALVAIGLRSYGLYLWHWPIYTLIRYRIDVGWSWGTVFTVRIVLTVAATELCYRLVERPWHLRLPDASAAGIRRRLLAPRGVATAPRLGALGSALALGIAVVVLAVPHQRKDSIGDSLRTGEAALANQGTFEGTPPTAGSGSTDGEAASGAGGPSTTTTIPPAPGTATVTLIGDSVMVGAAPTLIDEFGDRAIIDAKVSRQADVLAAIVEQLGKEGRLGSVVVVQVGINGTVTADELRAVVDAAAGRRVLIVNARVPRSWETDNNELVRTLVPTLHNAGVIDWYSASNGHRDWFLNDGVHLTETGRRAYADLIKAAVDAPPVKRKGT